MRSEFQITYYNLGATGRVSTYAECVAEFGLDKWKEMLNEMDNYGAAIPYKTIKDFI